MARGQCSFRQRDLTAAVKAVEATGRRVERVEIDPRSGKLVVIMERADSPPVTADLKPEANEWDV